MVAALLLALPAVASAAPPATAQLEREKLRQEIRQLKLENRDRTGIRGFIGTYGGLLAGFAAVGAALVGLINVVRQRNRDRQERHDAEIRRLEERFSATLVDLDSSSQAVQARAAVSLITFLRPEHRDYHRQVRLIVLADLKVRQPGRVRALVVGAFSDALRTEVPIQSDEVDLAGMELPGINLAGLDLRSADLRRARLEGADLRNTNLQGVDAYKVDAPKAVFQQANLVAVKFQDAVLNGARFESARLQSAHFDRAHLEGARFDGADINDAFIRPATFDEATLHGLSRATNKRQAHFSPEILERLRQLESARDVQQNDATPP